MPVASTMCRTVEERQVLHWSGLEEDERNLHCKEMEGRLTFDL